MSSDITSIVADDPANAPAPHLYPSEIGEHVVVPHPPEFAPKRWIPKHVLITPDAAERPLTAAIAERAAALGAQIDVLKHNRIVMPQGLTVQQTYVRAKATLAVVVSPPSQRKLQPIPPSADWQFHLARGCPAHCQYCYLAGSLDGPPFTRVYANLDDILEGLTAYLGTGHVTSDSPERSNEGTTFEASCYTDPLALEHLTGSVAKSIEYFGAWNAPVQLRWTTKFDEVDGFLKLDHRNHTRARFSVNAREITRRFEGGTASLDDRIRALGKMARADYPVGLTVAPIMPIPNWRDAYADLFTIVAHELEAVANPDLTVELITHRFTPGSKDVLTSWYPSTKLEMNEELRSQKRTKFGSLKYVYKKETMRELKAAFHDLLAAHIPRARILYWT